MSHQHPHHRHPRPAPPAMEWSPNARPPECAPQFSHIRRRYDARVEAWCATLLPGDYYVTANGEAITPVLGSCVSACAFDPVLGIGGMNHFMLPLDSPGSEWGQSLSAATRYGNVAMERMINDMLKMGASRSSLQFKLVGGGRVLAAMTDIGARNISFVKDYVRTEGFRVIAQDLGGDSPRKVLFFAADGRMRVRKLDSAPDRDLVEREKSYLTQLDATPQAGDIELF